MAVEAVAYVVIHKLRNLVTEESKTFEKVKDEVNKVLDLLDELRDMQSNLSNAEDQEQSSLTHQFLRKVYRVGDAIESFAIEETDLKFVFPIMKILKFRGEMNRFIEEIKKLTQVFMDVVPTQPFCLMPLHEQPNKEKNILLKKDVDKFLKQLITSNSEELQIVSVFVDRVYGEKDYFKKIYKKACMEFSCSALVTMKSEWSSTQLMIDILQQMLKAKVKLKEGLRDELREILKGQKYLIVIIGIKSRQLLEDLSGSLPDAFNASRVVIITSNEEAASFANASNRYHFNLLDKEEGFRCFISKAWGQNEIPFSPDSMEVLKNKIAEICHGAPLKIALLAGLLSTRGDIFEKWLKVFEQHQFATRSPSFDLSIFSFNDTPMHLKPCLLYLTLFPKGFEIPVRRLFRLWLAEGFVQPERGIVPEDTVEGYLKDLVKRNMVEITKTRYDESPKKCRIIGGLHDIFLPMALKIGLFHRYQMSEDNATDRHQFGIRRVVEYTKISEYSAFEAFNQNLQSYISFIGRQRGMPSVDVGKFVKRIIEAGGFVLLKVLDLEGVYRPSISENLGNLFHLRYLGLRSTFLVTLPSSIGRLHYLETLDIKYTYIITLPSSVWNLKHLHHICLNEGRLHMSAQLIQHRGPSQLQTLSGLFVDENTARKISSILRRTTNLRKLDITIRSYSTITSTMTASTTETTNTTATSQSSSFKEIASSISLMISLKSLRLRSRDKIGRPSELIIKPFSRLENLSQLYLLGHLREALSWYMIPYRLRVLTLSVSLLREDPMPELSRLPSLMVLRLLASSYVGEELHFPENGFPALRDLRLWKLGHLKTLTVDKRTMQKLHTLEIRCCLELKELPLSLLGIQSIEKLILSNMPESFVSFAKARSTKIVEINN